MTSMLRPNDKCPDPYSQKYGAERYDSTLRNFGTLEISFNGSELILKGHGIGPISYKAVSGAPHKTTGGFDYSKEQQKKQNVGPIPAGNYWINPSEMWERSWYQFKHEGPWGNFRITLHPFNATDTHCRGGFFIHGGSIPGSAGCIDLTSDMDRFAKDIKKFTGNKEGQIKVVVEYEQK